MGTTSQASATLERLARPQRLGIFGYRGVGKTTLITMLYREAVAGRLPGIRLAAGDTRTAEYLADKIAQLESGQPLPATLAETDLHLNLYHQQTRIELQVKDYQGEHLELGRQDPIHDFLRDCDAVWLCVDAVNTPRSASLFRRQQEMEQLIEHYLKVEPKLVMQRPFALILTKADLLQRPDTQIWSAELSMTCHALETHCSNHGLFAVSSLRRRADSAGPSAETRTHGVVETLPMDSSKRISGDAEHREEAVMDEETRSWYGQAAPAHGVAGTPTDVIEARPVSASPSARLGSTATFDLEPRNLAEPIGWLVGSLQQQDEQRLAALFTQHANDPATLTRAVDAFAQRYPSADCLPGYQDRLTTLRRRKLRRKGLVGAGLVATLVLGLWSYDALGYQYLRRHEQLNANNPGAALDQWQTFQQWHPTRNLLLPAHEETEKQRIAELERAARERARTQELAALRHDAELPDVDPEKLAARLTAFHQTYGEVAAADTQALRTAITKRRDEQRSRRAHRAFEELVRAEQSPEIDLPALVTLADDFLRQHPQAQDASEVKVRRAAYLQRLDERDIEVARAYSAQNPLNFNTRRQKYEQYLNKHPAGGQYSGEALSAIERIDMEWDRHDFRAVRDHFMSRPSDVQNLVPRCQSYLAAHPRGRFVSSAQELLRWSERVTREHEYHVVLKSGVIDQSLGQTFSYGPDTSVELIVNGVRYGPSTIAKNSFEPSWNFEFPKPVKWKMGDTVRIQVTDHDWRDRIILDIQPEESYPLAMWYLAGPVHVGKSVLNFESDFNMPLLPPVD